MKFLIWDLPTRLFHWLLAVAIILALVLAEFAEKETPLFYVHVVFGVLAGLLILWRIIWGIVGSYHAKWRQLLFTPASVINYFKEVMSGRSTYYSGHNPGSSAVILAMLFLVAMTVLTGILNSQSELFEELHESIPYVLLAFIGVHVAGVLLASATHGENYALSMLTGYKRADKSESIPHSSRFAAVIMLALVLGSWYYFIKGFDRNSGLFTAPGTTFQFQIGEPEEGFDGNAGGSSEGRQDFRGKDDEHDDDDDDD